jgi:predicted cupin superfamily sugar epimerase
MTAEQIANRVAFLQQQLNLLPHPEGGFFKETYRSKTMISGQALQPEKPEVERSLATMIYFLVTPNSFSALHKIMSDEGWHFYEGTGLEVLSINPEAGTCSTQILGLDFENGQMPQHVVPAGHIFGSRPFPSNGYALVGCTVAPGFDFEDFELSDKQALLNQFPHLAEVIEGFTR